MLLLLVLGAIAIGAVRTIGGLRNPQTAHSVACLGAAVLALVAVSADVAPRTFVGLVVVTVGSCLLGHVTTRVLDTV